jgi:tetratricopeptide (TPR) repeat protein
MTTELLLLTDGQVLHAALPPGEYIIGRDEDAGLRLDDPSISSAHARLVVEDNTITLEDLDSEHGTFIEEEPTVGATALYDGQTARVGNVRLRVRQTTDPRVSGPEPRYLRGLAVAAGGMGMIHEARQTVMGRKVAMKVMLHAWHERSVGRFLDEARITGMLEHPNIVPVHELGVDEEGQLFYTMKFVRGVTLAEVVAGLGLGRPEAAQKYPLATLLTVFQKVCDAVAFAHSRGVWHRDLKPENIMIGDYGEVLVMDWGLAKEAGFGRPEPADENDAPVDGAPGGTMEGTVLGTPTYMAPEQARGEVSEVDQRADVYALGAILHEILYLQPPVRGADRDELVRKVGEGLLDRPEPRPTRHLPAQRVPESLAAVSRKAMAFRPDERYQQVPDLQADITAYQSGFATSAEQAGAAKQFALFVKRNRRVSTAVAAALVSLAAVSGWFTFHLVQARWEAERNALSAEDGRREAEQQTLLAQEQTRRAEEQERIAREQARIAEENLARATVAERGRKEAETQRDSAVEDLEAAAGGISEAAARQLAEAENLILEERGEEALQVLDAAIALAPTEPRFRSRRGDLLQALWRFEESVKDYDAALAQGPDERVSRNLQLSRELAATGSPSEDARRRLERELMAQDREGEIPLMYQAADLESLAAGEVNAREVLLARLKSYKAQSRWGDDGRVEVLPDGALALDLSGLEITDLSMLRGSGVRELSLADAKVADLALLRGLKLRRLDLTRAPVNDLGPLGPMPLEHLQLLGTEITTLEPLRDMPLRELHADAPKLGDFSALGSLRQLEVLTLPVHAAGVDLSEAGALRMVRHARFHIASSIPAQRFRELSARSDEAWQLWGPTLQGLPLLQKIGPDRLTVREKEGVDLDLRGTGLRDLSQLPAEFPLRRLEIDTADAVLDLSPLAGRKTLRELDLAGANVASLSPLLSGTQLESIVVERDMTDLTRLRQFSSLQRIGFSRNADDFRARNTVEEFFGPRVRLEQAAGKSAKEPVPETSENFDDPDQDVSGWGIVLRDGDAPKPGRLAWVPDPVKEGGRGGGYIAYRERSDDGRNAYFSIPPALFKPLGDLSGYTLEFDMRRSLASDRRSQAAADLVISNGEKAIVRRLARGPGNTWGRVSEGLGPLDWAEVGKEDRAASESVVQSVLKNPQEILIRAEYEWEGAFHGVDIDDVEFWQPSVTRRGMDGLGG